MGKIVRSQINFNTVLVMIVGALVTLGITKADKAFTAITQLQVRQEDLARRVSNVETAVGIFLPPSKRSADK